MTKGARTKKKSDDAATDLTIPVPTTSSLLEEERKTGQVIAPFEAEERPTTVPDYDVEAQAAASSWEATLPQQRRKSELPLDLAIPIRLLRASVDGAPLRAAFLLMHVDDRMSIGELAASAQIPIADAIECFLLLSDLGIVELRGVGPNPSKAPEDPPGPQAGARPATPKSGLRPKS